MTDAEPIIYVVDDPSVRKSLGRMLKSHGYQAELFVTALEFLRRGPHSGPACLVLDLKFPWLVYHWYLAYGTPMTHTGLRIAVVDDDASVLKAVARLLRAWGYEVMSFASGSEFLEALEQNMPDCVVMDIHIPDMTGLDVHAAMLNQHLQVLVIFITAYNDVALRQRAKEQGASPFSASR